jgi:hypothetical protein
MLWTVLRRVKVVHRWELAIEREYLAGQRRFVGLEGSVFGNRP